jgi:hypothetical protein
MEWFAPRPGWGEAGGEELTVGAVIPWRGD